MRAHHDFEERGQALSSGCGITATRAAALSPEWIKSICLLGALSIVTFLMALFIFLVFTKPAPPAGPETEEGSHGNPAYVEQATPIPEGDFIVESEQMTSV